MKYEKIVTHNGKFHADEILAIALLFNFGYELPFERTRDKNKLEHYLKDPSVIVIDVGKNYYP